MIAPWLAGLIAYFAGYGFAFFFFPPSRAANDDARFFANPGVFGFGCAFVAVLFTPWTGGS